MAVFRVERIKDYTVMSNHHLRNKNLSLKAKGLLSQMLSLPDDWDYTLKGLAAINKESVDAIRTAIWELEDVSPTRDSEIALRAGGSAIVEQTTIPTSSSIQQAAMNRVLLGQMGNSVTDVEIGGGKIQGREIIPGRGQIQFAMYNAHQYEKPEGHFTEQTSRDGEKWYKVYATTRVEKTPTVQDERGRMQYDERKVAAMPKAPARRH